ncbi:hypothetical protein ACSFB5_12405, partial [Glaesserella parasuis]
MSQSTILDVQGLHTYASDISGVPLGSMSVALNVNINRLGTVEPRRGFDFLAYPLPSIPKKIIFWNQSIFAHYGSTFAYYDPASGWS